MWKEAELTIGRGSDRFTMNRGSFRYRRNVLIKKKLLKREIIEQENGFCIVFLDLDAHAEYRLQVSDENGRIRAELLEPEDKARTWNRFWIEIPAKADEHIYGCGETYSKFDLRGEKVRIWVAEHQNALRIGDKIVRERMIGKRPSFALPFRRYESYYAQPTFVSSRGYYLHADIRSYAEFDFRDPDRITLELEDRPVIYTEEGKDFSELSLKLSELLGRQKELHEWIYDGMILAMQGGTEVLEKKLQKALDSGIKVCGIWSQDWCGCRRTGFGYQVMWNWEWDRELYPDLDKKIKEWKEKGIRFLGYINPFMALEKDLYK